MDGNGRQAHSGSSRLGWFQKLANWVRRSRSHQPDPGNTRENEDITNSKLQHVSKSNIPETKQAEANQAQLNPLDDQHNQNSTQTTAATATSQLHDPYNYWSRCKSFEPTNINQHSEIASTLSSKNKIFPFSSEFCSNCDSNLSVATAKAHLNARSTGESCEHLICSYCKMKLLFREGNCPLCKAKKWCELSQDSSQKPSSSSSTSSGIFSGITNSIPILPKIKRSVRFATPIATFDSDSTTTKESKDTINPEFSKVNCPKNLLHPQPQSVSNNPERKNLLIRKPTLTYPIELSTSKCTNVTIHSRGGTMNIVPILEINNQISEKLNEGNETSNETTEKNFSSISSKISTDFKDDRKQSIYAFPNHDASPFRSFLKPPSIPLVNPQLSKLQGKRLRYESNWIHQGARATPAGSSWRKIWFSSRIEDPLEQSKKGRPSNVDEDCVEGIDDGEWRKQTEITVGSVGANVKRGGEIECGIRGLKLNPLKLPLSSKTILECEHVKKTQSSTITQLEWVASAMQGLEGLSLVDPVASVDNPELPISFDFSQNPQRVPETAPGQEEAFIPTFKELINVVMGDEGESGVEQEETEREETQRNQLEEPIIEQGKLQEMQVQEKEESTLMPSVPMTSTESGVSTDYRSHQPFEKVARWETPFKTKPNSNYQTKSASDLWRKVCVPVGDIEEKSKSRKKIEGGNDDENSQNHLLGTAEKGGARDKAVLSSTVSFNKSTFTLPTTSSEFNGNYVPAESADTSCNKIGEDTQPASELIQENQNAFENGKGKKILHEKEIDKDEVTIDNSNSEILLKVPEIGKEVFEIRQEQNPNEFRTEENSRELSQEGNRLESEKRVDLFENQENPNIGENRIRILLRIPVLPNGNRAGINAPLKMPKNTEELAESTNIPASNHHLSVRPTEAGFEPSMKRKRNGAHKIGSKNCNLQKGKLLGTFERNDIKGEVSEKGTRISNSGTRSEPTEQLEQAKGEIKMTPDATENGIGEDIDIGNEAKRKKIERKIKPVAFICPECNVSYKTKWAFTQHFNIHTGVRPYACNQCDKRFLRHGALWNHRNTHVNGRPYTCKICDTKFTQLRGLKAHVKRCHQNQYQQQKIKVINKKQYV